MAPAIVLDPFPASQANLFAHLIKLHSFYNPQADIDKENISSFDTISA
jgi:hypothetical protein